MERSVLGWVCVFALVALPVSGCSDESTGDGGSGGSAGTGGMGGTGGSGGMGGIGGVAGSFGGPGDLLLTCFCNDADVPACVETDCSAAQQLVICEELCADQGGVANPDSPASCLADMPHCEPPPDGTLALTCFCADADILACVATDCARPERLAFCENICLDQGGVDDPDFPASCFADRPECARKLLTCFCNNADVPSCVRTDCSTAERLALCEDLCSDQGGVDDPNSPASCFADRPECD